MTGFNTERLIEILTLFCLALKTINKNQLVYPYGLLREPFCYLKRADITISTKNNLIKGVGLKSDHALDLKIKEEVLSSGSIKNIHDLANKSGMVSVCSIGDPESSSQKL